LYFPVYLLLEGWEPFTNYQYLLHIGLTAVLWKFY